MHGGRGEEAIDVIPLRSPLPITMLSSGRNSIEQPTTHSYTHPRSSDNEIKIDAPPAKMQVMSRPAAMLETTVGDDLGEYVKRDMELFKQKG